MTRVSINVRAAILTLGVLGLALATLAQGTDRENGFIPTLDPGTMTPDAQDRLQHSPSSTPVAKVYPNEVVKVYPNETAKIITNNAIAVDLTPYGEIDPAGEKVDGATPTPLPGTLTPDAQDRVSDRDGDDDEAEIRIYNQQGVMVYQDLGTTSLAEVDNMNFSKGYYILQVIMGMQTYTSSFEVN